MLQELHLPPRSLFFLSTNISLQTTLSQLLPTLQTYTTQPHTYTMSAPQAGRQSPDPENQSGKQQAEPPASNPNQQGAAPSETHAKEASDEQKKGLPSNPTGPLDKHAQETTAKHS